MLIVGHAGRRHRSGRATLTMVVQPGNGAILLLTSTRPHHWSLDEEPASADVSYRLQVIGRLRHSTSIGRAQAQMDQITTGLPRRQAGSRIASPGWGLLLSLGGAAPGVPVAWLGVEGLRGGTPRRAAPCRRHLGFIPPDIIEHYDIA